MNEAAAAPLCLPPRPLRNAAALRLPSGTVDAHFHVFAEGAPLASPRSYTPRMEMLAGWRALAEAFGIERGVLVQPSVYGLDNSVLLAALKDAPERLRGIVVVAAETPVADLRQMDKAGGRGVRINLRNRAGIGLDAVSVLAPHLRALGWHFQFQVGPEAIGTVAELAATHEITAVIDHLAFMALNAPDAALAALQKALDGGRTLVKISAPYRMQDDNDHGGYRKVVAALCASHPDRLLWGSDWPHTELFDRVPEDDDLVALALSAVPEEAHRRVFVDTAKELYWAH